MKENQPRTFAIIPFSSALSEQKNRMTPKMSQPLNSLASKRSMNVFLLASVIINTSTYSLKKDTNKRETRKKNLRLTRKNLK